MVLTPERDYNKINFISSTSQDQIHEMLFLKFSNLLTIRWDESLIQSI